MIGPAVSEKIFENGGRRRTDDGRTPDHGYPISSPCEPNGSGELKMDIAVTLVSVFTLDTLMGIRLIRIHLIRIKHVHI